MKSKKRVAAKVPVNRGRGRSSQVQSLDWKQVQRRVTRQNKAFLSVAGVGASGFTDISVEHDTYLYEKP